MLIIRKIKENNLFNIIKEGNYVFKIIDDFYYNTTD